MNPIDAFVAGLSPEQREDFKAVQAKIKKDAEAAAEKKYLEELKKRSAADELPKPRVLRIEARPVDLSFIEKSISSLRPERVQRWKSTGRFSLAANAALVRLLMWCTEKGVSPCEQEPALNEWLGLVTSRRTAPPLGVLNALFGQDNTEKSFSGILAGLLQQAVANSSIVLHQQPVRKGLVDICFVVPHLVLGALVHYPTAFVEVSFDSDLANKRAQAFGYAAVLLKSQSLLDESGDERYRKLLSPIVGVILSPHGFEVHVYSRTFHEVDEADDELADIVEEDEEEEEEEEKEDKQVQEEVQQDDMEEKEEKKEQESTMKKQQDKGEEKSEREHEHEQKQKMKKARGKIIDFLLLQETDPSKAIPWSNLVHMLRLWSVEICGHLRNCDLSSFPQPSASASAPVSSLEMSVSVERYFFAENSNVAFVRDFDDSQRRCVGVWKIYDHRNARGNPRQWKLYLAPDNASDRAAREDTGLLTLSGDALLELLPHLYLLQCPFIDGSHLPTVAQDFKPILRQLKYLHDHQIAHGDIRLFNMLFVPSSTSSSPNTPINENVAQRVQGTTLIDFDFAGVIGKERYPNGFNRDIEDGERHPEAVAGKLLAKEHDLFALKTVMSLFEASDNEQTEVWNSILEHVGKGALENAIAELGCADIPIQSTTPYTMSLHANPVKGTGSPGAAKRLSAEAAEATRSASKRQKS